MAQKQALIVTDAAAQRIQALLDFCFFPPNYNI